jgi:RNA polymerase sigma factor (sigma-70 family)
VDTPAFDPSDTTPLSWEESQRLARLARAGDRDARDRLVASCDALAIQFAARYARGTPWLADDFLSECRLALILAVYEFDPERGMSFGTYVRWPLGNACRELYYRQRCAVDAPMARSSAAQKAKADGIGTVSTTTARSSRLGSLLRKRTGATRSCATGCFARSSSSRRRSRP